VNGKLDFRAREARAVLRVLQIYHTSPEKDLASVLDTI
jgi:hypothetical protein